MKPTIVFAIALLSGSLPLAAQRGSGSGSGVQGSNFGVAGQQSYGCVSIGSASGPMSAPMCGPIASACPAVFSARHLADGSMITVGRTHPKGMGQWLHINLMPTPGKAKVTGATLKVHGYSDRSRITETDGKSGPDAVRAVTVSFQTAPSGEAEGDVWAPGLTAVTSLDVTAVTYNDGSSWSAQEGRTCRVTPDPMMLISGR